MKCNALRCAGLAFVVCAGSIASAQPVQAQAGSADFDLVCTGTGSKLESQTSYDWDSKHHEYRDHNTLGTAQVGGTAQVEIHGGQGRVRLPAGLVPPLNSGGRDGWFPIQDLSVGADRIQGSLRLNGLNKPGMTIDRRSGRMVLDGMESFDATCSPFNPGSTRF